MPPLFRFTHSSNGYKEILRSDKVRSDLEERAQNVREAAQGQTERALIADSYIGAGRAGATVIGVSMTEETEERVLGRAIDAAAG